MALYENVAKVLVPNPSDRVGVDAILRDVADTTGTTRSSLLMIRRERMGGAMRERAEKAESFFTGTILRWGDCPAKQEDPWTSYTAPRLHVFR